MGASLTAELAWRIANRDTELQRTYDRLLQEKRGAELAAQRLPQIEAALNKSKERAAEQGCAHIL